MKEPEILKAQLVIATGLLALSYIFKVKILITVAFIFLLLVLVFPSIGKIIVKGWFKFAEVLGKINSKILLSLVFYIFLLPMSWIYKLTTKNPLQIKKSTDSMFIDRNHQYQGKDMENIW